MQKKQQQCCIHGKQVVIFSKAVSYLSLLGLEGGDRTVPLASFGFHNHLCLALDELACQGLLLFSTVCSFFNLEHRSVALMHYCLVMLQKHTEGCGSQMYKRSNCHLFIEIH